MARFLALTRGDGLKEQLLRGGAASLLLKLSNVLLSVGTAVVLGRALGPEGYGVYAFAFSLVMLLAIPAQGGIPKLLVREVAKYQFHQQWSLLKGAIRRANQAVLIFSVAMAGAAGVIARFWWSGAHPLSRTQIETFAWGLLLVPLVALGNLRGGALRGLRRVVQGQLPETILRPGGLFLAAGIFAFAGALTPSRAMALHVGAAAVAFVIGAMLLRRTLPPETRSAVVAYDTRAWAASVVPFAILAGAQVANKQTDIVILGILTSSREVGLYKMAVQASALVAFALQAVNMIIAPHITRLYQQGDSERLQQMVTWSARVILAVALPAAAILIVFGEPILDLMVGAQYRPAHRPLAILCLGQLVNAGLGPVGLLLNMTGHELDTLRGFGIAAALSVVLNLGLVPFFGMEGAAAAGALSLAGWNLILYVQVKRRLGIRISVLNFKVRSSGKHGPGEKPR